MAKKPADLLYGVDEKPPLRVVIILALQHIFFLTSGLITVSIVMTGIGCSPELTGQIISMSMIAGGLATILQALNKGPVGSGYLCTEGTDPSFVSLSILCGATGGLPVIFGMTIVSGIIECMLARIMHRLRTLFPPEVTGTVLTMVGFNIIPIMILDFFGVKNQNDPLQTANVAVAVITLGTMVATNVWSKGKLRLYSVIIGIVAGYAASVFLGVFTSEDMKRLAEAPIFSFPDISYIRYSFDIRLLVPVIVVTLASTLKSVATLTMCQKINDTEWTRPDLANIGRGTLADGIASILGGLFGAMGKSLYTSSVGLSVATGATSRIIAYYTGGIYMALAFLPKMSAIFSVMPKPVMGGAMVFMVCFMVISGIQMMTSRMIDIRRTFVIAVSLMFGLSADVYPVLYRHVHPWLQPFFSSSLAVTTVLAIVLNLIMRLGVARRVKLELVPGEDSTEKIFHFMENQGAAWGARKEVVYNAMAAMNEFMEAMGQYEVSPQKVIMHVSFDELNLDVKIDYEGQPMEFPAERPDKTELRTNPRAFTLLSGYMIRQYADKVTITREGATCHLELHFDH